MRVSISTQNKLDCRYPNGNQSGNPDIKHIDWGNSSDRKWLMNHLHWAVHNGKQVRITPLNESN